MISHEGGDSVFWSIYCYAPLISNECAVARITSLFFLALYLVLLNFLEIKEKLEPFPLHRRAVKEFFNGCYLITYNSSCMDTCNSMSFSFQMHAHLLAEALEFVVILALLIASICCMI